jgi:hypothetical protein
VPNTAARIGDVTAVARDDVNVEVEGSGRADVHTEVVAVGLMGDLDGLASDGDRRQQRRVLLGGCVEPGSHMTTRDEQGVAGGDGKCVPEAQNKGGLVEDPRAVEAVAERAG